MQKVEGSDGQVYIPSAVMQVAPVDPSSARPACAVASRPLGSDERAMMLGLNKYIYLLLITYRFNAIGVASVYWVPYSKVKMDGSIKNR